MRLIGLLILVLLLVVTARPAFADAAPQPGAAMAMNPDRVPCAECPDCPNCPDWAPDNTCWRVCLATLPAVAKTGLLLSDPLRTRPGRRLPMTSHVRVIEPPPPRRECRSIIKNM